MTIKIKDHYKEKEQLGVFIRGKQMKIIDSMRELYGIDKAKYIRELLDKNLPIDFENAKRQHEKKKKNNLI